MPRRSNVFNAYVDGLKCEFVLMAQEIELLQKERDEYKEKVNVLAEKLDGLCRSFSCGRCRNGRTPSASSPSGRVFQSKPLETSGEYGLRPSVVHSQKKGTHHSTRRIKLIRKLHTSSQPSQSKSDTASRPSGSIAAHSQTITLSSQPFASTVDPDPDPEQSDWPIVFNSEVRKELDLQIVHALAHAESIWSVNFSQDGKYLAAGCQDGKVYIYDVQTGTLTHILRNLLAEQDHITYVCFSHDGKYLATTGEDTHINIWDFKTKYVRNAFKGHTNSIGSLNFSPNGRLLVSASGDGTVRLWNMRDGDAKILTTNSHCHNDLDCYSSVFSPDGRFIATSHRDGVMRIWAARTGQLLTNVKAHLNWMYGVAFMPDGKSLVSGGRGTTIKYWDVSSLYLTRLDRSRLPTSLRPVSGIEEQIHLEREFSRPECPYFFAISPDGRWIASGSVDKTVRIWDPRDGEEQCILSNDHEAWKLDFSPAGGYLASGGLNGTVRIWRYSYITPLGAVIFTEGNRNR